MTIHTLPKKKKMKIKEIVRNDRRILSYEKITHVIYFLPLRCSVHIAKNIYFTWRVMETYESESKS
jgi:hypothetical protein